MGFVLAGRERASAAMSSLTRDPIRAVGLVAAAILAGVVRPLWGSLHPWAGWHRCRGLADPAGFADSPGRTGPASFRCPGRALRDLITLALAEHRFQEMADAQGGLK